MIEDDRLNAKLTKIPLSTDGYEVRVANTAKSALAQAKLCLPKAGAPRPVAA